MSESLVALLADGPDDDVLVYGDDQATTRGELRALASGVAARLAEHGLVGRVVGVLMPNVAETIGAWFGIWQAGGAFAPLNPRVPAAELARMGADTDVQAVLTQGALGGRLPDGARPLFTEPLAGYALPSAGGDRAQRPGAAILQFTSGTTGRPRPVPLDHATIVQLLDSVIATLRGDRKGARARMPNLVPVSLSLWAGIYQVLFAFRVGAPVVLMERFDTREFARLVTEYGIRSSVLPPAALVMLTADDSITSLAPLRYVRSVSAPLSPVHARRFHERFGVAILNGYGQTELGGEVVGWSAADWKRYGAEKLGAVGRAHSGIELRVRGDDGSVVGAGVVGELEIRSPASLPRDAESMTGRVTPDGWLRTGDLARIDAEGFVWLEGRVSSMINRGGLKVFPDEVEEVLRSLPGVLDAAVAGVPDARLGEVPWAFVVTRPGTEVGLDAVHEWCRARLAPYKVPVGVTAMAELPRNEMGKLLRQDLVALADPGPP